MEKSWKTYEEVATYLLDKFASEFGLSKVEGKQEVKGKTGATWEIDAKGVKEGGKGFIVVECKRHIDSKQPQATIGSLAFSITDTGASGGIIVSPLGLQKGAQIVADAKNIINVTLDVNSTPNEFGMKFLNKIMIGKCENVTLKEEIVVERVRKCQKCSKQFTLKSDERFCPDCIERK